MAKRKLKYPQEIFVTCEAGDRGGESYLMIHESADDAAIVGEDVEVAVYERVGVRKIKTTVIVE